MSCNECKCSETQEQPEENEESPRDLFIKKVDPGRVERELLVKEIEESEDPLEAMKDKLVDLVKQVNDRAAVQGDGLVDVMATMRHLSDIVVQTQVVTSALVAYLNNKDVIKIDEFAAMLQPDEDEANETAEEEVTDKQE